MLLITPEPTQEGGDDLPMIPEDYFSFQKDWAHKSASLGMLINTTISEELQGQWMQ